MVIELSVFSTLISFALLVTCLSPLILLGLLIRDWRNGTLW